MTDRSNLHGDINANIYYKYDINLCKTSHLICYLLLHAPAYSEVYNTSNMIETNDNTSIFVKSLYCLNKRCAFVARKHVLV